MPIIDKDKGIQKSSRRAQLKKEAMENLNKKNFYKKVKDDKEKKIQD